MLTIKIIWNGKNSEGFPMYSVFTANKYIVDQLGPRQIRLLLDDDLHDISLSEGCRAYVMNSHGATVDTIIA